MEATSSTATQEQGWSSLSADLLHDILARLPWSSHPRFAAVCTHWLSVVSPFYPAWLTPVLLNSADVGSTNIRYYSPYYHKNFELAMTLETPNAKLCCANGHQLTLCHRGDDYEIRVVDVNLVTGVIYDLSQLECASFDFVIYDGGKRMFGIEAFAGLRTPRAIRSDSGGWYRWESSKRNTDEPMLKASAMTNPVLHRGLLYLLGVEGRLAVHDDSRHEEGFQLLDNPKDFGFECGECYLFESDEGELMAVLMGWRGPPVRVVKLNEQTMEWEKVESLEGRALLTGTLTSMIVKTDVKWMQNRIFMPRLYDWPEAIQADLVDREGELAFVQTDAAVTQDGCACGSSIWSCGLGPQESSEFWETIKADYTIGVDLRN